MMIPRIPSILSITILMTLATAWIDARPTAKPNIIFVVADDMGYNDAGYSGNTIVKTPCLDKMAAESLRFDKFYSAAGTCSPGRMAIMTGRSPLRGRMVTTVGPMQEGKVTVAAALKTAGYETAHFGKWGLGREGTHPLKVGFDEAIWSKNYFDLGAAFFVGDSDKRDEAPVKTTGDTSVAIMDIALDFIGKRAKREQPFFAQICFGSQHAPHQAAEEFKKLYPGLPENEQNLWGEISGLDAAVGKLREELRRLKIADNTLVWFVTPSNPDRQAPRTPGSEKQFPSNYTIGGMMVFPGNRIGRKMTINGARGFHPRIKDRFDLTVECVRRHYGNGTSPLTDVLARYADFFALFVDFRGYVEFFLLQDLVTDDFTVVKTFTPFVDFNTSPLPASKEAYLAYMRLAIEFIEARNRRILGAEVAPVNAARE